MIFKMCFPINPLFISAAAHIHDDEAVLAELFGEVDGAGEGVTWF